VSKYKNTKSELLVLCGLSNTSNGFTGFRHFFINSSLSTKYIPKMIKQRLIKKVQQKIAWNA